SQFGKAAKRVSRRSWVRSHCHRTNAPTASPAAMTSSEPPKNGAPDNHAHTPTTPAANAPTKDRGPAMTPPATEAHRNHASSTAIAVHCSNGHSSHAPTSATTTAMIAGIANVVAPATANFAAPGKSERASNDEIAGPENGSGFGPGLRPDGRPGCAPDWPPDARPGCAPG